MTQPVAPMGKNRIGMNDSMKIFLTSLFWIFFLVITLAVSLEPDYESYSLGYSQCKAGMPPAYTILFPEVKP